jgi:YfiH family protein
MNIIKSDPLNEINFINHGFFDKTGGESKGNFDSLNVGFNRGDDDQIVLKNRKKIAEYFEVNISDLIILNQVHGDIVHVIDKNNVDKYKFKNIEQANLNEGDAIITNQKGLLIGISTADCAPILLCDKDKKYIAAIHAGWRGATGDIIENTIKKMKDLGCNNLTAVIGPCMQKRYFEIKEDVIKLVEKKYLSVFAGKTLFDMQLLILEKLLKNSIKTVSKLNIDTMANDNYFSYRRQGGISGTQFSGIMIKE